MPRDPRPLPASLGEGFSVRQAADAGVTRRRLRGSDLEAPLRGVRLRPRAKRTADDVPDAGGRAPEAAELRAEILRRARAYATIAPPHALFTRVTAAIAWGLPLPLRVLRRFAAMRSPATDPEGRRTPRPDATTAREPRELDVGVPVPHRASKASGIRGHQLKIAPGDVRSANGLTVTSPAMTWALLAPELSVDELIELGDAIVRIPRAMGMRRGDPASALASIADLEATTAGGRRHGATKLREALPQIRVGSASPPETRVRLACVRAGLPEPALDVDVFDAEGHAIGYTELAYIDERILIEYEGDHHRTDRAQWYRDIEKHAAAVAAGWNVIRLTAKDAYPSTDPAVAKIRAALLREGWPR